MGIIQRCLRHIFARDDIVITLKSAAVYNPVEVSLYQLDWQYVALLPREVFEANRKFLEQVCSMACLESLIECRSLWDTCTSYTGNMELCCLARCVKPTGQKDLNRHVAQTVAICDSNLRDTFDLLPYQLWHLC